MSSGGRERVHWERMGYLNTWQNPLQYLQHYFYCSAYAWNETFLKPIFFLLQGVAGNILAAMEQSNHRTSSSIISDSILHGAIAYGQSGQTETNTFPCPLFS